MTGNDEPVAGEVGTGPSPPRRDGAHRHGVFAMVAAVARTVQVERRLGEGWILGRAAHAHRADRLAAVREARCDLEAALARARPEIPHGGGQSAPTRALSPSCVRILRAKPRMSRSWSAAPNRPGPVETRAITGVSASGAVAPAVGALSEVSK